MFQCWHVKAGRDTCHPNITTCLPWPYKIICFLKSLSRNGGLEKYNSSMDNIIQNMTLKHKSQFFFYFFLPKCKLCRYFYQKKTKTGVNPRLPSCGEIQHHLARISVPQVFEGKCLQRLLRHSFHYLIILAARKLCLLADPDPQGYLLRVHRGTAATY